MTTLTNIQFQRIEKRLIGTEFTLSDYTITEEGIMIELVNSKKEYAIAKEFNFQDEVVKHDLADFENWSDFEIEEAFLDSVLELIDLNKYGKLKPICLA